jgi:hypothetical protein
MSGVHFIDGQYYVEVERDAKIDDYVTKDGILRTVTGINEEWDSVEFYDYVNEEGDRICGWGNGDYKTLEPISTVDTSEASPAVIDMFTALSRKIVSLEKKLGSVESQLRDVQNNLEKQAIELENARHRIAKHADRFAAVEDKVEMLTDDIVTLDSRSQALNAINRYYAEVYR